MTDPEAHSAPRQVRAVYERIARHFSKTRANPWPEVETFLADAPEAGLGVAVGCGNGRHLPLLAERSRRVIGLDASRSILAEAGETVDGLTGPVELCQADAVDLPIRSGRVGLGLYIATVHHLPDRASRRASLDELARVLRPGGRALVSAWATAHDRFDASADDEVGFDTTVDWTLPDGETVPRFYHVYAPAEFEADLAASDLAVESVTVSSGNCFGAVRR
jgi:SAM-dependent methyltransferase